MADDWYFEPELVRLRENMLLAHEAWTRAAPTAGPDDAGSEASQYPLMLEVRKAVDAYMDCRDRHRRHKGAQRVPSGGGSIPENP